MTPEQLAALRQERGNAYNEMRRILDEVGDGAMSAEQSQEYDRHEARFDELDGTISRAERAADRDRSSSAVAAARREDPERAAAVSDESREQRFGRALDLAAQSPANMRSFLNGDEYREAFVEGLIRGRTTDVPEYRAALALAADDTGGYTAPVEFVRELFREAAEFSVLRRFARNIQTSHGRELQFPELATTGQAGWTNAEVTATPDNFKSEPTFGPPKTLHAHPAQREVVTSKDLLQDSVFDIEGLIRELIAESFVELADAAYMTGDGNGKPTGLITGLDAANVVTGAAGQTGTVTTDDLIDVQHKIKRRYRQNARWLLADSSVKAIRKLVDGNGQYIWQPGLTDGEPGRILGKPYEVDEYVPEMAASATSIVYGDLSGYWTRDVLAVSIQRLVETYARNRQVGFLADMRVDGALMRPERVAAYKNPAA